MYGPEENLKWLCKHTHGDLSVLLANVAAWSDFYTHCLAMVGIVNREVVQHLGVYRCHGYSWHLVIWLIPHWSLYCDDGTVVLYFNSHQWRTEGS